jgi:hypothetical protein
VAFHTLQDQVEEQGGRHARLQEELALHYLLRVKPEAARDALLGKTPDGDQGEVDPDLLALAADPYFGTIGGPESLPPFLRGDPPVFGALEEPGPAPSPDQPTITTFPAFPIAAGLP